MNRHPSGSAAFNICREAARRWSNLSWLQHSKGSVTFVLITLSNLSVKIYFASAKKRKKKKVLDHVCCRVDAPSCAETSRGHHWAFFDGFGPQIQSRQDDLPQVFFFLLPTFYVFVWHAVKQLIIIETVVAIFWVTFVWYLYLHCIHVL